MSETTEKNQIDDKIDTEQPDKNTWNKVITHARSKISSILDELPLNPQPDKVQECSNQLKELAESLDKLATVYHALQELRDSVSK